MHIQHNESISGHTGNISGAPPFFSHTAHTIESQHLTPDCGSCVQNPHMHSGVKKTRAIHFTFYFTYSPEHRIFLFFTELNNEIDELTNKL